MRFIYQTDTLTYGPNVQNFQAKLQELLNVRGYQGWHLVKYEMSDALQVCVVVFEKCVE